MDNLIEAAKKYANTTVANKDRKDIYPIMDDLYNRLIFPESRERFTPDELKNIPISSGEIFEDQIFVETISITNIFELVMFCVKSSSRMILDFLRIPGVAEEEPSIGYDMYMYLTLFERIRGKNYEDSEHELTLISVQLDVIRMVNEFVNGQLLDEKLIGYMNAFDKAIDDVSLAQVYKSVSDEQMPVLHELFAGY